MDNRRAKEGGHGFVTIQILQNMHIEHIEISGNVYLLCF